MTAAERVVATLSGRPADRRPVVPVLSLYGARLTACPLERYYADPRAYADGQAAVREAFEPDVLCAPFAFAYLGEVFGGAVKLFADQAPNLRRPAVASAADWARVPLPAPEDHPRLAYLVESVRLLAEAHGPEVPVAAVLPPPTDLPALAMGIGPWLETVLFEPEAAARIAQAVIPFFVRLANRLFEAGAALAVLPCGFASPAVVTREVAARFAVPSLAAALGQLRGPAVLHHAGGPLLAHLDLLAGLPAIAGFALDDAEDLAAARSTIGEGPALLAGVAGPALGALAPAEVEARCRRILADRRGDPRFLLCTSGPDVPWETPAETIRALRAAAEAEGGSSP